MEAGRANSPTSTYICLLHIEIATKIITYNLSSIICSNFFSQQKLYIYVTYTNGFGKCVHGESSRMEQLLQIGLPGLVVLGLAQQQSKVRVQRQLQDDVVPSRGGVRRGTVERGIAENGIAVGSGPQREQMARRGLIVDQVHLKRRKHYVYNNISGLFPLVRRYNLIENGPNLEMINLLK